MRLWQLVLVLSPVHDDEVGVREPLDRDAIRPGHERQHLLLEVDGERVEEGPEVAQHGHVGTDAAPGQTHAAAQVQHAPAVVRRRLLQLHELRRLVAAQQQLKKAHAGSKQKEQDDRSVT